MTGMSPSAQAYAEGAVTRTIKSLESKRRPELQAGMVLTDVHNGDVLAVIGSREVSEVGFNRAIEAQRPVGSLLKPFGYLLALAQPDRYSLASWVDDSPVTVQLGRGRNWNPGNADNRSHGTVRLIDALAHSYNQATVRVGMQVGGGESGGDPRLDRPEPVRDGTAVPVPGVRRRDPAVARGAWRARSAGQAAQAL
ncbi:hypothetical protein G6F40_014301 [Rhizopus arrhizus]|nr:hypothetical protein G6F40_014301 [Rhizopus arrhizus]